MRAYSTSKTEITTAEEKTEIILEEEAVIREEGVWREPDTSQPQTQMERVDDWFVLLDVVRRETPYVPAGTA